MNAALCGRGGGRSGFAQGSAQTRRAEIEFFFAQRGIPAPAEKN
jgi:alanyl-tRNA synthetase